MKKILIMFIAFTFLGATACRAQDRTYAQPNIEYSADEYIESEETTMHSKIYYSPGKTRKERKMGTILQITILRYDKKALWILMPEGQMCMEIPLDGGNATGMRDYISEDFNKNVVIKSDLGQETINGIETTRSMIVSKDVQGREFEGTMWHSKDGIMVKIESNPKDQGWWSSHRMKIELKNIEIAKQDPQLFEVPEGYTKMAMPGIGRGIGNNLQSMEP